MRRAWFRPRLASLLMLALCACPGDDSGGSGMDTDAATGTGSTGDATGGLDSTGSDDGDGSSSDSTGEPAGVQRVPCDPTTEDSCEEGVCSGHPMSGFYCRPGCSSMAESGTPCGADDVCLPVSPGAVETACFDVRECDVLTGDGCSVEAGDSCVVVSLDPLRTACVPAGDGGAGQGCAPAGMLDCGPGLACLGGDLPAGTDGACTPWCEPGAGLPPDCPSCVPVGEEIGTCAECGVLDDSCPDGSQCQIANELLGGECVGTGPGLPGAPCSALDEDLSCGEGLLCVDVDPEGDGSICLAPCDLAAPMCAGEGESCVDLDVLDPALPSNQLGVCIAVGVQVCDPAMRPTGCMMGDNCLDVGGGVGICGATCDPALGAAGGCDDNFTCFPSDGTDVNFAPFVEGNGACGQGCTDDLECGGGTCLHLDGLDVDGLCGATCTPGMPGTCAMGQTCVATPEDPGVGACMVGGTACNPTNVGECGAAACIPMEGEMLIGMCLPLCFSQDPAACGGMPAQCNAKTDPIWHEGTCVGGGEPCELIDDSCGPGLSCNLLGGQAFGGQSYSCDAEGPLGEGGDCSMDEALCGKGVGCIGGVCRTWCDPMADDCVTGTCTDVGLGFYLPPGTLGACL